MKDVIWKEQSSPNLRDTYLGQQVLLVLCQKEITFPQQNVFEAALSIKISELSKCTISKWFQYTYVFYVSNVSQVWFCCMNFDSDGTKFCWFFTQEQQYSTLVLRNILQISK